MFTGEDMLVVYSKIWENPAYIPLAVGAIVIPIVIIILALRIAFIFYLSYKTGKFLSSVKYIVLAVDIPKNNEQNLVAVEQLYVNLTAIKFAPNLYQRITKGMCPLSVSVELISIDGYIQFLIRASDRAKDLVSSSIYAQYPEAEIVVVDDYVSMIPDNIGEPECPYQLWGTEFILDKPSAFPIKTYKMFEHSLSDSFNDPLTPLLEAFSRMGVGESAGLQIILTPLGDGWKKKAADEVKKILGAVITSEHPTDKYLRSIFGFFDGIIAGIFDILSVGFKAPAKAEVKMKSMAELTPGEKVIMEKIQDKLALPSFSVTMRYFYLAKKELFNRNRGVDSIKGAMSQFGQSNLNSFSMHATSRTDVDYYFIEQRLRPRVKRLAAYYKARSRGGATEFFLSTEELATIYHFPSIDVKTPMLPKSMIKKSQPPSILPTILEENFAPTNVELSSSGIKTEISEIKREDLYNIINSLPGYDFTNKYYEQNFSVNNSSEKNVETKKENNIEDKTTSSVNEQSKSKYSAPSNLPFIQE